MLHEITRSFSDDLSLSFWLSGPLFREINIFSLSRRRRSISLLRRCTGLSCVTHKMECTNEIHLRISCYDAEQYIFLLIILDPCSRGIYSIGPNRQSYSPSPETENLLRFGPTERTSLCLQRPRLALSIGPTCVGYT
jgi:hypothetical protein